MELQLPRQFKMVIGSGRIGTRGEIKRITIPVLKAPALGCGQVGLEFIGVEAEGAFRFGNEKFPSIVVRSGVV